MSFSSTLQRALSSANDLYMKEKRLANTASDSKSAPVSEFWLDCSFEAPIHRN
jgi:hypothetical protein